MKITITHEFTDIDAALAHLAALADPAPAEPKTRKPRKPREPVTVEQTHEQAAAPAADAAGTSSPEQAPDAAAPTEGAWPLADYGTATHDEALHALRKTFNEKGASAASKLLGEFGAARFSEIPKARYGEFVAKAG